MRMDIKSSSQKSVFYFYEVDDRYSHCLYSLMWWGNKNEHDNKMFFS